MNILVPLATVGGLFLLALLGGGAGMGWLFGIVIPYLALALFFGGLIHRVMSWANVPVPFRIPTTCGQQKSLPWIKQEKLENPDSTLRVIGRMAMEILLFRSLLRNTNTEVREGRWVVHSNAVLLWLAALAMHWMFLFVLLRHVRFFAEPVPFFVTILKQADEYLQIGVPPFHITSVLFLGALAYLLVRRFVDARVRYISLAADYLPLFLLLGIGCSGFWLRHIDRTDLVGVKEMMVGLATFSPSIPETVTPLFFGHLMLVCVLLAYFPFSKLSHMAGVFLSPTRNMASNNRMARHINPWDYPVKVHSYEEYENDLRDKMKGAGIPVEKE